MAKDPKLELLHSIPLFARLNKAAISPGCPDRVALGKVCRH